MSGSSTPFGKFDAEGLDGLVADLAWNVDRGNLRPRPDPETGPLARAEDRRGEATYRDRDEPAAGEGES